MTLVLTKFDVFERALQKTNQILNTIEDEYGWQNHRNQSYQALRSVLHAVRDRLPVEVAVGFGAQLPTIIRGFYYEGWDISKAPQKMNREEFVNRVRQELLFSFDDTTENLIKIVMLILRDHIDPAEIEKIKNTLPEDVRTLIP